MTIAPAPPTPLQTRLLRAVTLPAAEAMAAWDEWRSRVMVDDLEPDSQWLLPLLYIQLRAAGVRANALERYANVYRHNWYKNQVRLNALRPVWAALPPALRAGGHAPVLVGGAALAAAYYPALGARPFDRVALYAPGLAADEAKAAEAQFDVAACPSSVGVGAGLRWHTLPVAATHKVVVAGQALCVPDPAEALVQVCAGAGRGDDASALLWATDAVLVSRQLDEVGWAMAWQRAAELGLTELVQRRLDWLGAAGLLMEARTAV